MSKFRRLFRASPPPPVKTHRAGHRITTTPAGYRFRVGEKVHIGQEVGTVARVRYEHVDVRCADGRIREYPMERVSHA